MLRICITVWIVCPFLQKGRIYSTNAIYIKGQSINCEKGQSTWTVKTRLFTLLKNHFFTLNFLLYHNFVCIGSLVFYVSHPLWQEQIWSLTQFTLFFATLLEPSKIDTWCCNWFYLILTETNKAKLRLNNGFFRSKGHPSINQAIYRYELPVKGSLICSKGISRVFLPKEAA